MTIQPGYTFREVNDPVTTSKLNRLGQPTATITGTIGGTNAGISAASLNGTMMVDAFAGSNLTWDASSPRRLVIANSGADTNQIAAGVAGAGLGGGGGTNLHLKYDPAAGLTITNDTLTVTNLPLTLLDRTNGALNFATNYFPNITATITGLAVPSAATSYTNTHTLGVTPAFVRAVLVCGTTDQGYAVGDEVDFNSVFGNSVSTGDDGGAVGTLAASSSNVVMTVAGTAAANWRVRKRSATVGTVVSITPASWTIKIYLRP